MTIKELTFNRAHPPDLNRGEDSLAAAWLASE